ncbi:MAG: CooT family nickel-binding protein [Zestosphaera sp.]
MCEYKVLLDGELILDEVIYARAEGGRVILRNVLGESKVLDNCVIVEVNVEETKLVLARAGALG